jgi:hypothetical protein
MKSYALQVTKEGAELPVSVPVSLHTGAFTSPIINSLTAHNRMQACSASQALQCLTSLIRALKSAMTYTCNLVTAGDSIRIKAYAASQLEEAVEGADFVFQLE